MTARIVIPGKGHKYNAKRTEYRGRMYPSKAQAERAAQLDLMKQAGEIVDYVEEVTFELGCRENKYRVDFVVFGRTLVLASHEIMYSVWAEEVKGAETAKFKRDRKLWAAYGPFDLHIIHGGKVEIVEGKR